MPELPEVEVTRRSIAAHLAGALVTGVRLGKPLRWPLGCLPASLVGTQVGDAQRRGKYIWLPLSSPHRPAGGLLLHLGMSGSLAWMDAAPAPGPHDHFDLSTPGGTLRLTDPRRFGAVVFSASLDADPACKLLARLGPEPFDAALTPERFHAALQARRTPVKAALLGGALVVGAGNIYACEALFLAGIDPRTPCQRLSRPRAAALLAALRDVLGRALAAGGTTLRDFRDAQGHAGAFQVQAQVYGRAGAPCTRCATPLRRINQAQRSSFFCPLCQRR